VQIDCRLVADRLPGYPSAHGATIAEPATAS
jgi:hypothetical protein